MGKSAPSPPAPDPNIGKAALKQAETGEDWLEFTREAFDVSTERQAELDALTKDYTERQLTMAEEQHALSTDIANEQRELAQEQAGYAREDRQRYKDVFQPVEDAFVDQASTYDTEERRAAEAAEAKADVQSAAAQRREASEREAASMGINPASGRFQGVNRAADLGTALGSAGAQNTARKQVEATGLALKADVANLGRGLPAQSSQATALGLNAGNASATTSGNATGLGINALASGIAAAQNNQSLSNSATGITNAGFSGAMQGYAGMGNTLQRQYDSQIDIWRTQQQMAAQNAAGIGQAFGGLLGLGAAFLSDEEKKKDKKDIPEGAALDAVKEAPASTWEYKKSAGDGGDKRHVGPMAQDMRKATGLGTSTTIEVQDMLGLHHAAIGELDRKVDKIAVAVGVTGEPSKPAANSNQKRKHRRRPTGLAA
jgi:hypothetical protein